MPAGSMMMYVNSTPPAGWLAADGSAVSRTTYASLFAVIGTTYGAGNGSTTFNLPDLRGRVPLDNGQGAGLTNRTLGASGGEEDHLLTAAESGVNGNGSGSGYASLQVDGWDENYPPGSSGQLYPRFGRQGPPNWGTGGVAHGGISVGLSARDADSAHNNMQPYLVVSFIIKY